MTTMVDTGLPAISDAQRRLLRDAAEEILTRGIWHGSWYSEWELSTGLPTPTSKVCAGGALILVEQSRKKVRVSERLWEVLDKACPRLSLINWNDEVDADGNYVRTAEDVAELFLNVADNAPER